MFDILENSLSFTLYPARLIFSLTLGRLLSFAILPGQFLCKADSSRPINDLDIQSLKEDVFKDEHNVEPNNQYILYFGGNAEDVIKGGIYDSRFYKNDDDVNSFLIKFNYPGVGNSKGSPCCYSDLVDGAEKVIDKLLEKGIDPKQIVLHGLSIGGSISLYTYKRMLDRGIELGGVFNDRSFSTLSDAALGMLGISLYDSNIVSKLFYIILKPVVKAILWLCMWEMNPYSIYKEIQDDKKDLIAIMNEDGCADGVIHHGASMYRAVSNDMTSEELDAHSFHNRLFYNDGKEGWDVALRMGMGMGMVMGKCFLSDEDKAMQHMVPLLNNNADPNSKHKNHKDFFQDFQHKLKFK